MIYIISVFYVFGGVDVLGTVVNSLAIIAGSIVGIFLKGGIKERFNSIVMNGLALCILLIGISGALKVDNMLLVILSIVIGGVLGEFINIDKQLNNLGSRVEEGLKGKAGKISEGFVAASLLYCVGAMAVVGSLESGLSGNYKILFTKSILDGVSAIILTSSLGAGVALSAVSVFVYQGIITVAAFFIRGVLNTAVINDMTAVGSLLIIGLSLNMLGTTKIKIANLLPAVFIPVIYELAMQLYRLL